jgi:hypothetical protein
VKSIQFNLSIPSLLFIAPVSLRKREEILINLFYSFHQKEVNIMEEVICLEEVISFIQEEFYYWSDGAAVNRPDQF